MILIVMFHCQMVFYDNVICIYASALSGSVFLHGFNGKEDLQLLKNLVSIPLFRNNRN